MKEILKMIKFCAFGTFPFVNDQGMLLILIGFLAMGFFVTPTSFCFLTGIVTLAMVAAFAGIEDEYGYSRQYGILPIERRNIVRGKVWFAFAVPFACEILSLLLTTLSYLLKLGRLLPLKESYRFIVEDSFSKLSSLFMSYGMCVYLFFAASVIGTLLYMLFEIFGRENRVKIYIGFALLVIMLTALFMILNTKDLLPVIELKSPKDTIEVKTMIRWIAMNIAAFGLTALFAEIAAAKSLKREL